jgi:hypothetical protein
MTADTIRNYFLKAGASLRQSEAWRREHEDAFGRSRVLRTGRFGVGALAAFLLGDEIEVTTRHALSLAEEGINFVARLDDEAICLSRVNVPIGTRIRIRIPEYLRERIRQILPGKWQGDTIGFRNELGHYFLKAPSLERTISSRPKPLQPSSWLPQPEDGPSKKWRCFKTDIFQKVFWTYSSLFPALSSNGIVISQSNSGEDQLTPYLLCPNISIFDKDGYLPVDLKRTSLQTKKLPFHDELLCSIATDIIAYALVDMPDGCRGEWLDGEYEGFYRPRSYEVHWARWFISQGGFILNDPYFLKQFNPEIFLIAIGGTIGYQHWGDKLRNILPSNALVGSLYPEAFDSNAPKIKGRFRSIMDQEISLFGTKYREPTIFVPKFLVEKIRMLNPGKSVTAYLDALKAADARGDWLCIKGALQSQSLTDHVTSIEVDPDNPVIFYACVPKQWNTNGYPDRILKRWLEVLDTPMIPFAPEKRHVLELRAAPALQELLHIRREEMAKRSREEGAEDKLSQRS